MMTHHNTILSCTTIASLALACAASAQTAIIDSGTLNGSFENGTGTTPNTWIAPLGADQASRNDGSLVTLGTWSAVIGDTGGDFPVISGLLQNTGFNVSSGDTFNLSFDWSGASRWTSDNAINYRLFTTSDDTITGAATVILMDSVSGFTATDGFQSAIDSSTGTVGAISLGRDLWVEFIGAPGNDASEGAGSGFARLDNIGLTVSPIPEPSAYALLAGMLGLTWVMLRRR
jgi:hypothetical protein